MGALKIICYCNEIQMNNIVKAVTVHLYDADDSEVCDFDDTIGGVRVCVGFDYYLDEVRLKNSEILDADWDLLYEDTAVFTSRLRAVVDDYNRQQSFARRQALQIKNDHFPYT